MNATFLHDLSRCCRKAIKSHHSFRISPTISNLNHPSLHRKERPYVVLVSFQEGAPYSMRRPRLSIFVVCLSSNMFLSSLCLLYVTSSLLRYHITLPYSHLYAAHTDLVNECLHQSKHLHLTTTSTAAVYGLSNICRWCHHCLTQPRPRVSSHCRPF